MPSHKEHRHDGHAACSICSNLGDREYACQKYGWPENDTQLPPATGQLVLVRDLRPEGGRQLQLLRCPACGTYYLYRTDYEYLTNGSEDEQFLDRLSASQASELLEQAGSA